MELVKIISIIITSSVLAAIMTSLFNIIIQNLNYKKDYYKKIIDKRIEALEYIIDLTNQLKIMTHLENGQICNNIFMQGEESYNYFMIRLALSTNYSFWLDDSLNEALLELNIFLKENIESKINEESDLTNQFMLLGTKNLDCIRDFRNKIESQLLVEFSMLQKIKPFIKKKNKTENKSFLIRKLKT